MNGRDWWRSEEERSDQAVEDVDDGCVPTDNGRSFANKDAYKPDRRMIARVIWDRKGHLANDVSSRNVEERVTTVESDHRGREWLVVPDVSIVDRWHRSDRPRWHPCRYPIGIDRWLSFDTLSGRLTTRDRNHRLLPKRHAKMTKTMTTMMDDTVVWSWQNN